jgi:hypothetical protein
MSDITPKNYSGLMEAYASIYNQPEQIIQEQVEEEICFEDLEVDNDLMVDLVVDRLIVERYANTEDEALNMIPHMSDAWLDTVVGNFVLEQNFIDTVNSIIEEGYDLSSYTVDELYGEYIGHFNQCVNEQYGLSLQEAIPLVAAPLAGPAIAAGLTGLVGGAAKLYQSMQKRKTDPASQRWLETGSYASSKQTPKQQRDTAAQRRQQAADRLRQKQQQAKPPAPQSQPAKPPAPAQPAAGGAPSAGPTPPKPPKGPNFLQRLGQAFKQSTAQRAAQKSAKPPGPSGSSGPSPRMQKATDILTNPFTKGAAATFTGTSALGDIRGGGQGLRTLGSLPVGAIGGGTKAIGYLSGSEGIKQTGRDIEKLGSVIKGGGEKPAPAPKPEEKKAGLDLTPQGTIRLR